MRLPKYSSIANPSLGSDAACDSRHGVNASIALITVRKIAACSGGNGSQQYGQPVPWTLEIP
jgi:hypothetical protein